MKHRVLVRCLRGALFLALAVALQGLRLVLPLPLFLGTFLIGTLVSMMLIVTVKACGLGPALFLSCLLPVTAYLEGQLALPFLIPVVMLGNSVFCAVFLCVKKFGAEESAFHRYAVSLLPPLVKAACMFLSARLLLQLFQIEDSALKSTVLTAMSLPQFVTGCAGLWLAERLLRLLDGAR